MTEQEKQDNKKTVITFVAGLLAGALLVWVFSPNPEEAMAPRDVDQEEMVEEEDDAEIISEDDEEETVLTPELTLGEGDVVVTNHQAGNTVVFDSVTFPIDEGWITVRTYNEGRLGNILGASRFSRSQGLVPETVSLLTPTVSGNQYAIVFFTEDGDRTFNTATDVQVEGVFGVFTAR